MPDRRDRRERAIERWQQTDNAWSRFDIRYDNAWVAIVIGVAAAVVVVGTALASVDWKHAAMWLVCVVWAALGCWYVPRRAVRAELDGQRAWADPDRSQLLPRVRRAAGWTMLTYVNLAAGIGVLLLLDKV